jgi:hypothetical protein
MDNLDKKNYIPDHIMVFSLYQKKIAMFQNNNISEKNTTLVHSRIHYIRIHKVR